MFVYGSDEITVEIVALVIHDDKSEKIRHRHHEDRFHTGLLILHELDFLDEIPAKPCGRASMIILFCIGRIIVHGFTIGAFAIVAHDALGLV